MTPAMDGGKVVFVREQQSGKYLSKDGLWVESLDKAATFGTTSEAYNFCARHSVRNADIVLRTGDPEYDVVLPLTHAD